jgi:energy-coupling factor transporter ATP-binding protein EcfA2
MIQVHDLTVRYETATVLEHVSLQVAAGECVLVTGPSGCGKSTLVRVLSGLIPHAIPAQVEGRVEIGGLDVRQHTISTLAQSVGSVFQNPSTQLFHLSVEAEVAFGLHNLGMPAEQVSERVTWALDALGLAAFRSQRPSDLSGGQKQRLAIASALAMQPSILVLDEPTASLDVPGTQAVISALEDLRRRLGITIILVEHRLAEAARLAERTVILNQGRIVADGPTRQVLGDRHALRQLGLRRPVMEPMTPWQELLTANGKEHAGAVPLLEMAQVSAGYTRQPAIHEINLRLFPGEFVALVGDNGAGKSTLALAAAGLLKPKTGKICFNGGKRPRPGLDISLLFQNPADQLFTDSVDEEVAFGPLNYQTFDESSHLECLEKADLLNLRSRRLQALSVGQQQRAALAACLSLHPHLLILDEPTLGQDWGHLQRLMDFLTSLNRQNITILLITHDYKLVHRYAHRVVLMETGRITLDGHLRQNL